MKKSFLKQFKLILCIMIAMSSLLTSKVVSAAPYYTWNENRENGGVGNWGYSSRYYFIDLSSINAGNSNLIKNAMNSWIYTSNILSTPISYRQTTYQPSSVLDVYSGSYFPAAEKTAGVTEHYLYGTRIYPHISSGRNWGWAKVNLNSVTLDTYPYARQQAIIAHEMGHSFGLAHNYDSTAYLMYPWNDLWQNYKPTYSDLLGINHLY